jgi:hypothetical protein
VAPLLGGGGDDVQVLIDHLARADPGVVPFRDDVRRVPSEPLTPRRLAARKPLATTTATNTAIPPRFVDHCELQPIKAAKHLVAWSGDGKHLAA